MSGGVRQLMLEFPPTWGGRRRNAGRKRVAPRPMTPHRARPLHDARHPVHVTLRAALRPLRSQHVYPTVRLALLGATRRDPKNFRILQYSVQYDHLHLVVEASSRRALSSGVRSIAIRVARYVNDLLARKGPLWADRWHGRALTSPRAVRTALVYVLANFRKHTRRPLPPGVDRYSSGEWFDGWRRAAERAGPRVDGETEGNIPVSAPRTWLARAGWRRHGAIGLSERPKD